MSKHDEVVSNSVSFNAEVHMYLEKTLLVSVSWDFIMNVVLVTLEKNTADSCPNRSCDYLNSGAGCRGLNHTLRSIPSLHGEGLSKPG